MGGLGQALGGQFSLDDGSQQQGRQTGTPKGGGQTSAVGEDLPKTEINQNALGAMPGTAENELYIESINDLEGWLSQMYGQGIFPDKVGDGSPETQAMEKIYRMKKASIRRQAGNLAHMAVVNKQAQESIMKGKFYDIGETEMDPMTGKHLAPTEKDYDRLVSTSLSPSVTALKSITPSGSVYDAVAFGGAVMRHDKAEQETNEYYDELAAKFADKPTYQQNIEAARTKSLTTLNTLKPIRKRTPQTDDDSGDDKEDMSVDDRNKIEAEIMSGNPEALTGGSYGKSKITSAKMVGEDIVIYGKDQYNRNVELGRFDRSDRESIIGILNQKKGFGAFTRPALERGKQFDVTDPPARTWQESDQSSLDAIMASPDDDIGLDAIRDAPGVTNVKYATGNSTYWGYPSIDITTEGGEIEELSLKDADLPKTRTRIKQLIMQANKITEEEVAAPVYLINDKEYTLEELIKTHGYTEEQVEKYLVK